MTIKQKILNITILIFAIGMIVVCIITSDAYMLLQRTEYVYYPYLRKTEELSNRLTGIQDGLLDVLDSHSERSINRVRDNAESFRETTRKMVAIVGKKEDVPKKFLCNSMITLMRQRVPPPSSSASKMGTSGLRWDASTVSLNKLKDTLQREQLSAAQTFEQGLVESRKHVQEMLVISLLSALAVFLASGFASCHHRSWRRCTRSGRCSRSRSPTSR